MVMDGPLGVGMPNCVWADMIYHRDPQHACYVVDYSINLCGCHTTIEELLVQPLAFLLEHTLDLH
jgi:hypothetical protein